MLLRRKVINRIKPKTVNGQVLDGAIWIQMVEQYVKAINEGVVPNIHNSWTYICKQNAQKVVDQCKTFFENEVSEVVQMPMNVDDLESFLKDTTKATISVYSKNIKGDIEVTSEY